MKIDDLCKLIIEADVPLILIDTCSVLDLYRCPYRRDVHVAQLSSFLALQSKAASKDVKLVVAYKVNDEFRDKETQVIKELESEFEKLIQRQEKLIETLCVLGVNYEFHLDGIEQIQLAKSIQEKIKRFFQLAKTIDKDEGCMTKAAERSEQPQAPAKKGKRELADCIIIEHYLALAKCLRDANFSKKIFFITSNKNDFGPIGNPAPPLDQQFSDCNIRYVQHFAAITHDLDADC